MQFVPTSSMLGLALCAMMMANVALAEEKVVMVPERLTCEYRVNPQGIDAATPRLTWGVSGCRQAEHQCAFQILVATTEELLAKDQGDLWDSGRVESESMAQHSYGGAALQSRQRCFWKVRVWSTLAPEQPGPWSATAQWSMGLLNPDDWKGRYVGMDAKQGNPNLPWLRKTFSLDFVPTDARVYVNTLGYYELYINGTRIDDYFFTPAASQLSKRSYYLVHDVTRYLVPGKNTIALWLGRGWYVPTLPGVTHNGPVVRAQLEIAGPAGQSATIVTDGDWKVRASNVTPIGDGKSGGYGGERLDPATFDPAWAAATLDDSAWNPVEVVDVPAHTVCAQRVGPNRVQRRYQPRIIRSAGDRTWIIDFGTNLTGLFDISFTPPAKGKEVLFEYYDNLDEDMEGRDFSQHDVYVSDGAPQGHFAPRFNYHAFRYVKITGLDTRPRETDVSAALVHSDLEPLASFACSNTMLTSIHDMIYHTLHCLSLGGFLVDCPHAERLGYGGDGLASTPTALTMFGMGALYTGWIEDWRDCQRDDGDMPHTAPNPWNAGGGPFWCAFIIGAPRYMASLYNDQRILETNYAAMQHWLDGWVEANCKDDLLMGWDNKPYRNWYLGDWAQPGRLEKERTKSTHLVGNCVRIQAYDNMAHIAAALGKTEDAARYRAKADSLRPKVHAAFYDAARGTYADDTQMDLAYALLVDVVPAELRESMLKRLEQLIVVEHKGHLDVGLVGIPVLVDCLLKYDRNDLLFTILNDDTFPGYGYMIRRGATTTWEHWDGQRSHIHNCYNGIGSWFYRGVAGILPDPNEGYVHPTLRPGLVGDLTWAQARQETVVGTIQSHWRIQDKRLVWDIEIPPGARTATMMVPADSAEGVAESGKPVSENPCLNAKGKQGAYVVFEAQPGRYAFSAPRP